MMETAKVDIRKLQLLNDRINQCIDALNQVRLSVHGLAAAPGLQGLSHTGVPFSSVPGVSPVAGYGAGYGGFGVSPFTQGIGLNPAFGFSQGAQGFIPGLSHTSGLAGVPGLNPYVSIGATGAEGLGLEAAIRPMWADPFLTARITQTFPYAQFPAPPVVTIY